MNNSQTSPPTHPLRPDSGPAPYNGLRVAALAGGVGGAKLVWGLAQLLSVSQLSIIVNTADDFVHLGLHISPDLDTVMYTLAGVVNPAEGWGLRDETWNTMNMLARYGGPTWFRLGDQDIATHLMRSKWLNEGFPLTWVTRELCKLLGVGHTLLPMSDDPVQTVLDTLEGPLPFQEYFVHRSWQPVIKSLHFDNIENAQPATEVVAALRAADLIVLCPSNPFVSLDPILALPAVRRILAASRAPKLAVSPIVAGQALKGPAAKMMAELGMEVSPVSIARHYRDLLTGIVIDDQDAQYGPDIAKLGIACRATNTLMKFEEDRVHLARALLDWSQTIIQDQ